MEHNTPLISTIVVGLVLAFLLGLAAHRVRLSPLVGYLLAGVAIGPFTPGYVADQNIASELAEIGVILLMFGVGLHFSLKDLLSVQAIAIPGAVVQIAVATAAGHRRSAMRWAGRSAAGWCSGWRCRSRARWCCCARCRSAACSTADRGRIAVGWLIVEDLAMVLALVLLPPLAGAVGERRRNGAGPCRRLVAAAWR